MAISNWKPFTCLFFKIEGGPGIKLQHKKLSLFHHLKFQSGYFKSKSFNFKVGHLSRRRSFLLWFCYIWDVHVIFQLKKKICWVCSHFYLKPAIIHKVNYIKLLSCHCIILYFIPAHANQVLYSQKLLLIKA